MQIRPCEYILIVRATSESAAAKPHKSTYTGYKASNMGLDASENLSSGGGGGGANNTGAYQIARIVISFLNSPICKLATGIISIF